MIELKEYQHTAVNDLLKQMRLLLPGSDQKICVFKAPTGSGKTIMMAELLNRLSAEELPGNYVYIWTSLYDLHSQSKKKLASYLEDTRYNLFSLDEIGNEALNEDSILFVNWHSLTSTRQGDDATNRDWSNVYVKDREDGRSIIDVLNKTRALGREIILIVDEAHRNYLTENSQRFISEVIQPKLTLEVSATPLIRIDAEDMASHRAGLVSVAFSEVVKSGLIKAETVINQSVGAFLELASSADDVVVQTAVAMRSHLAEFYTLNKTNINPLMLIQLPSESERTSALDISVRDEVEQFLEERGITYENGKLAVWLSDDKRNLEHIEENDNQVEVLIFKEAVAVGWDCPRAQILVMLRAIRSLNFEIQTVGRILRMPEGHHYATAELNKAYVYSNIAGININNKPEDLEFFKNKFAHLKKGIENTELPSVYIHRQDYGDLTASFSKLLVQTLNARFGISDTEFVNDAYAKADTELELNPEQLKTPIIADVVLHNLDTIQDEIGTLNLDFIQANVSNSNIQKEFDYLLKAWCLPYAPARSISKLKNAIYRWFALIGYSQARWSEVQRIIACSPTNQRIFDETIKSAMLEYEQIKPGEIADRKTTTQYIFKLPEVDMFGENYQLEDAANYAYEQCFLRADRSEPEKYFEQIIIGASNVEWWYKNGVSKQQYFAIPYETVDEETKLTKLASFYPDYIVKYMDGSTGIYDTKAGQTVRDRATHDKSDALQSYIAAHKDHGLLKGGILNKRPEGIFIYDSAIYNTDLAKWGRFKVS
jgi:type III restriction enzyme